MLIDGFKSIVKDALVKYIKYRDENGINRRFAKVNRGFWRKAGAFDPSENRVILAEQAFGANFWSLIVSISAAIVASALRGKVIFLMQGHSPKNRLPSLIQKSFCTCEFVYIDDIIEPNETFVLEEAKKIFSLLREPKDILSIRYKDIPIGEQVYDGVIKYKHATLWNVDDRVLHQIEFAIRCVETVLSIFEKENVVAGVFTHTTCTYYGTTVRTILSRGRPVFFGVGGLNAMYKYNSMLDTKGHLDIHIKIPVRDFDLLLNKHGNRLSAEADAYYKKRFGGEINDWDAMRAFSQDKKLYRTRDDFFSDFPSLNPKKKKRVYYAACNE
jgi:hypothetical protein